VPTPVFLCGAECQVPGIGASLPTGGLRHWGTFGASVTVQAGGGKTAGTWSAASYKFNPAAAATTSLIHTFAATIAAPSVTVVRFRLMFDVLPDAIHAIVSDDIGKGGIRYNPTGTKLEAWSAATASAFAGSFVPVVGVWYRVECRITLDTTFTTEWKIDGVDQTTATKTVQTAVANPKICFGHNGGVGGSASTTGTWYVDDICVSGTTGDYPLGGGIVVSLYPRADGAHSMTANDFQASGVNMTNSTTNGWASLLNPLSSSVATSFIAQVVIRTTGYAEFLLAQLGPVMAVNGLAVVSQHHGSTTGAHTQSLRMEDGATESAIMALVDYSDVTASYNYKAYATAPSTSGAWTQALVNALKFRFGYSDDVTGNPRMGALLLEVDLMPYVHKFPLVSQAVPRAARY